jgi:hypothetical protein
VPVFFLTGVYGERYAVARLLANLSADYTVAATEAGTEVAVQVTVPDGGGLFGLFGERGIPTRLLVSQGAAGTLGVYGATRGTSGTPMTVRFTRDVP